MIRERYLPLDKAAKILGVTTKTARAWLEMECGLVFRPAKFRRSLVAEADVQRVIDARAGKRKWTGRQSGTEATEVRAVS